MNLREPNLANATATSMREDRRNAMHYCAIGEIELAEYLAYAVASGTMNSFVAGISVKRVYRMTSSRLSHEN